ncbi:MAG: GNAT family N-acetyltransferase [Hamadaea sp.]|nr:GNAT family N-acetyltransferase [Hamadaea sp.]NUT05875.1 GNAT family N-acetyltransferase [Hamadaea sp.]
MAHDHADIDLRELTETDAEAAWRLGSLAFGYHDRPMPTEFGDQPGRITWGAFDRSGRLLAKAVDRDQGQWFGGRVVPTSGVAGVAVAAEARRTGLSRAVLTRLLAGARDRGAAISTLYPTTPFPYRRVGWEEVGALTSYSLPTASLATVRDAGLALRPATVDDVPGIYAAYNRLARTGTGLMDRFGPLFTTTPEELVQAFDGLTVAVGPSGSIDGYASWERGSGYDESGRITAYDVIATTAEATGALLAMFGGWASVAPTTVLRLAYPDPLWFFLASPQAKVVKRQPWMLRVVDAARAVETRGWPEFVSGSADLELVDEQCPWNAGRFRLVLDGGAARLEPGGTGAVHVGPRALGVWYAGAAAPDALRRAGLLTGGDDRTDAFLQAATAGPAPTLLDYF